MGAGDGLRSPDRLVGVSRFARITDQKGDRMSKLPQPHDEHDEEDRWEIQTPLGFRLLIVGRLAFWVIGILSGLAIIVYGLLRWLGVEIP